MSSATFILAEVHPDSSIHLRSTCWPFRQRVLVDCNTDRRQTRQNGDNLSEIDRGANRRKLRSPVVICSRQCRLPARWLSWQRKLARRHPSVWEQTENNSSAGKFSLSALILHLFPSQLLAGWTSLPTASSHICWRSNNNKPTSFRLLELDDINYFSHLSTSF